MGGTLADRFGRVRVLTFVILGYSPFAALPATAQNVEQLLSWRICHGFAFGAEWAVGAALLAEYADPLSARSRPFRRTALPGTRSRVGGHLAQPPAGGLELAGDEMDELGGPARAGVVL